MKLTNRLHLPEAIVHAVKNDPYDKGDCDFSATQLLKPPRMIVLEEQHKDKITEDVADRLWSLYGQIAHGILERANKDQLVEERFFTKIGPHTISAQIDTMCLEKNILSDYKFTTSWKFKNNMPPDEWVQQMNIQAYILGRNNVRVKKAFIVGLLRDWSKLNALKSKDYPQTSITKVEIPLWPLDKQRRFIEKKINRILRARGILPKCSQEERWADPDKWAVYKPNRKKAHRVCDNEDYAKLLAEKVEGTIKFRKGESKRCEAYCRVAEFCSQYKEENK